MMHKEDLVKKLDLNDYSLCTYCGLRELVAKASESFLALLFISYGKRGYSRLEELEYFEMLFRDICTFFKGSEGLIDLIEDQLLDLQ